MVSSPLVAAGTQLGQLHIPRSRGQACRGRVCADVVTVSFSPVLLDPAIAHRRKAVVLDLLASFASQSRQQGSTGQHVRRRACACVFPRSGAEEDSGCASTVLAGKAWLHRYRAHRWACVHCRRQAVADTSLAWQFICCSCVSGNNALNETCFMQRREQMRAR
ncbi:hypothetical protein VPH35_138734 [Triticum aestivum]|uniref:Uncharacterized protein n=1 Tax=Aegilops tauschii subsp. strangulata TaxID=200361 RepID=A0A453SIH2_AEGTS